jgi:hypothetical protein
MLEKGRKTGIINGEISQRVEMSDADRGETWLKLFPKRFMNKQAWLADCRFAVPPTLRGSLRQL